MTFLLALFIVCVTTLLCVMIPPSAAAMGNPVYMNAPPVILTQSSVIPRAAPVVKPNPGHTDDPLLKKMLGPRLHRKFKVTTDRETMA